MFTNKMCCEFKKYAVDGNIDDVKFVEVEGVKVQADEKGEPIKDKDGKYVPFEDKKVLDDKVDVSGLDLETLAKINPNVAKFLEEKTGLEKKLGDIETAKQKEEREKAEKNGDWQKLAEERLAKATSLEEELAKVNGQLGKYVGSVESILKDMLKTIPADKQALIPADYSARQKLEYITKNAKILGVKPIASIDKIDPSDDTPAGTDEEKLIKEFEELKAKTNRTQAEDKLMYEKASKIKELRAKKGNA